MNVAETATPDDCPHRVLAHKELVMHRRAIVLSKILFAAPLFVAGGGSALYFWPASLITAAPADVDASLRAAGINPQTLAAAGVSAAQTTGVFEDASAYLADGLAALQTADAAVTSARCDVSSLERVVVAGTSSSEQRTALAAARSALSSALTSRSNALNALVTAATAELDPERASTLATIRANASHCSQPVQYLAANCSEANRLALREALAAVRIAGEQGVDPDEGSAGIVNSWNSDPAVAAATTGLNTNLAAVTAAWAAALAP